MLERLEKYYNDGLLIKQTHPTKDLTIWNYSRKVQYDNLWDEVTSSCRGLVTNSQGEIIARCFKKFKNIEEYSPDEIPNESFEVTEKMDGQFGLLFYYDNEWIVTSRGSFESIYAYKAKSLLAKYDYEKLSREFTYLMEIIFEEGRIVCSYDFEDLVILAMINTETNVEESIYDRGLEDLGFKLVKRYNGITDYKLLKSMVLNNAEGFVIRFKSGFRVKIKGAEYVRLHRIITNISNRDIWQCLKDNKPLDDILSNVPDEFDDWVREQINKFYRMYTATESMALAIYYTEIKTDVNMTQKEIAEVINRRDKKLRGLLFAIHNGKDYSNIIWEKLYPNYEKPFSKMID